ncbi:MAG: GxxExxY protein [Planctomycetaceae bacterium]|nr:GxxExxY protein [Planctomycetaceae bacterium]
MADPSNRRTVAEINALSRKILGAAVRVHRELGPGLLESAYEACLVYELIDAGHKVERQKPLPLKYRGVQLDCGYRLDLLVEDVIVVEIKAVTDFEPVHTAQMISYLRLSGCTLGLLLNFNKEYMRDGMKRIVLGLE